MTDDLELRRKAAAIRAKLTDEQMNANLRAAVKGHTPHGDRKQAELAAPLTDAELKAGGGWMPAITDVDMTPRPRYRESQAAFEARMASYGADVQALRNETRLRNRSSALRVVLRSGSVERWESVEPAVQAGRVTVAAYFTQCACGWCGLRVEDPEVARREYDAHVCAAASVGQAAVDRAIAETDRNVLVKRERHVLQPSLSTRERPVESWSPVTDAERELLWKDEPQVDEFEQRVKLLETK